jgi:dUTP pyrophosphatase
MNVLIKKVTEGAQLPQYKTAGSAAADISACVSDAVRIKPGERAIIPTGLAMTVPEGYEVQIRARSGLSSKYGVCLANGVGTIDADYRGEVGVILINLGDEDFLVEPGMRIAQMAVTRCEQVSFLAVDTLEKTERGEGGYGSTGH